MADALPGNTSAGVSRQQISFAIAALNEEALIEEFVTEAHGVVSGQTAAFELILINDGSTDRTGELMEQLATALPHTRVLHNPANLGLGRSYMLGLQQARYANYMLLCGDGGLPAASLPPILAKVGEADMVLPHITNLRRIKSPLRYALSRGYTGALNLLFGFDVKYYNGLPVHRTDLVRSLEVGSDGFGYQAEIAIKLIRSGHSYTQVGVPGSEKSGRSRALRFSNIFSVLTTFRDLLREIMTGKRASKTRDKKGRKRPISH